MPNLHEAAMNHTSTKVREVKAPPARIRYTTLRNGQFDISIINSSVRIQDDELQTMGVKLARLRKEDKLAPNGTMLVSELEAWK